MEQLASQLLWVLAVTVWIGAGPLRVGVPFGSSGTGAAEAVYARISTAAIELMNCIVGLLSRW